LVYIDIMVKLLGNRDKRCVTFISRSISGSFAHALGCWFSVSILSLCNEEAGSPPASSFYLFALANSGFDETDVTGTFQDLGSIFKIERTF